MNQTLILRLAGSIMLFCSMSFSGYAQDVLMAWDFAGFVGNEVTGTATTAATNISLTAPSGVIGRGVGLGNPGNADRFNANDWDANPAPTLAGLDYMDFTITPAAGYGMELTSITFNWQRSGTGPDAVALTSSLDGHSSIIGSLTTLAAANNGLNIALPSGTFGTLGVAVTFRIYGYNAGGAAGTAGFEGTGNDLIINGYVINPEPSNHISGFAARALSGTAIELSWAEDAIGPEFPAGYLLVARTGGTPFATAVDGTVVADDLDFSDDAAAVNIPAGTSRWVFTGLNAGTSYDFLLYPYSNPSSGINIDYKTDLVIPAATVATASPCAALFFSEYVESAGEKFLEIYNGTGDIVDLSLFEARRYANGNTTFGTIPLTGYLAAEDVLIVGNGAGSLATADITSGNVNFTGNDAVALLRIATGDTLDVIGRIGENPGTSWNDAGNSTEDQVLIRQATVGAGVVSNPGSGFPTLGTEWNGFTDLVADNGLGSHDATGGCASGATCAAPAAPTTLSFDVVKTGSIEFSFTAGLGADRNLVIISTDPAAQPVPTDGVIYGPGQAYGTTGTVLSFDATSVGIVAGELLPNTTYYVSIFSYTSANCANGPVYNGTVLTGNQTTLADNPTTLVPGDLMIMGYDNSIGSGDDRLIIAVLRDLGEGTSFTLSNAVYEVGDAANVRSGRWFDAGGTAGTNISSQRVTLYDPVGAGSIICLTLPVDANILISDLSIDGMALDDVADFDADNVGNGGLQVNISTSAPDPIFLMQGTWDYSSGTHGTFSGSILGGLMVGASWYAVSDDLSGLATGDARRTSRIPPDITCLAIQGAFTSLSAAAYYDIPSPKAGTQRDLIAAVVDKPTNWVSIEFGGADATDNIDPSICTSPFTVGLATRAGEWLGGSLAGNTDWFICENWDNYQVPDSTVDVLIPVGASFDVVIDESSLFSDLYADRASCRDLVLASGTSVRAGSANLYVFGDWDNQSTTPLTAFDELASTVHFRGGIDQTLNPTIARAEFFEDVNVDKTAGRLILNGNMVIEASSELALVQGLVNANGNSLSVRNTLPTAISAFSNLSYVYGGILSRRVEPGNTYPYPVGEETDYQLAQLITDGGFGLAGDPDTVATQFFNSIGTPGYLNNFDGTDFFSDLLNGGIWQMTPSGVLSGTYGLELNLRGSTNAPAGGVRAMKATVGGPYELAGTFVSESIVAGTVTAAENGYTSFSNFGIGQNVGTNFPVEYLSFTAEPLEQVVQLQWSTLSELNNDYFVIERSENGRDFEALGQITGAGSSAKREDYRFVDPQPLHGWNHYRLRQVDFDGGFQFSETRQVNWQTGAASHLFQVHPNPSDGWVTWSMVMPDAGSVLLVLLDAQGREVKRASKQFGAGVQQWDMDCSDLHQGLYLYQLRINGATHQGKLIKR